jgi:DNA polymerase I
VTEEVYDLFTASYRPKNNKPVINLRARDKHGNRRDFFIEDFKPYFYVPDANGEFVSIHGGRYRKLEVNMPGDVKTWRENYPDNCESDIPFPQRFCIDHGIKCGFTIENGEFKGAPHNNVKPRVLFIDIEVEAFKGVPDVKTAFAPIYVIGCYDSYACEYMQFIPANLSFKEEAKNIREFLAYFKERDFDLIVGWNVFFDIAYIIGRCMKLNVNYFDAFGKVTVGDTWIDLARCEAFDLQSAYKKFFQQQKFDSYSLEAIFEKEFERPLYKYDYNTTTFEQIDVVKAANIDHTFAIGAINAKWNLIGTFDEIRRLTGCNYRQSLTTIYFADSALLHRAHNRYVLPTRAGQEAKLKFEGAIVKQPPIGKFKNVVVLDFKKMYPSMIIGFNMSPETISETEISGAFEIDGVWFKKEPRGMVPEMLIEFIDKRNEVKYAMKKMDPKSQEYETAYAYQYALKQMVDACLPGDVKIISERGIVELKELQLGEKILTPTGFQKVTNKISRGCQPIIEVSTRYGFNLKCTHDHVFIVREFDKKTLQSRLVEKKADFLQEGNFLQLPTAIPALNCITDELVCLSPNFVKDSDHIILERTYPIEGRTLKSRLPLSDRWRRISTYRQGEIARYKCDGKTIKLIGNLDSICNYGNLLARHGKQGIYQPLIYNLLDVAKLIAWFTTEGCLFEQAETQNRNSKSYAVNIYQKTFALELEQLLQKMKIKYAKFEGGFKISSAIWFRVMQECGKYAKNKKLPDWILQLDNAKLSEVLNILILAEGYKKGNESIFTTSSEKLLQQILYIALRLDLGSRVEFSSGTWRVHLNSNIKRNESGFKTIACVGSEEVFDITVENDHTFYAGNRGFFLVHNCYGVMAQEAFRLYTPKISKSTTYMGRFCARIAIAIVEKYGYRVIYVDTDSVLFEAGEDWRTVGYGMEKIVNEELAKLVQEKGAYYPIEVDFELAYKVIFFKQRSGAKASRKKKVEAAKKRYAALVMYEGDQPVDYIKVRGLEFRRSDSAKFTRKVQFELLKLILGEASDAEIKAYILQRLEEFKNLPVDENGIPKRMNMPLGSYKNVATVREVWYAKEYLGLNIEPGQRFYNFMVKRIHLPLPQRIELNNKWYDVERVACVDKLPDPASVELDWMLQMKKVVEDKLRPVLDSAGIEWFWITEGHKGTTLGDFGM